MTELSVRSRATALLQNGKWGRWINRGFWTLFDRGLFALSNFGMNIVLARWMSLDAYGAFAIAFSTFTIIGAVQSTFVTGPFLVFAPRRYRERHSAYLGLALKYQFVLSLIVSVGLAFVGVGFYLTGSRDTGAVLVALAISCPFILLMWLLRTTNYAKLESRGAAISGLIYLIVLLSSTYLLFRLDLLTPATALFLMAGTSFVVAIWLAIRQRADLFAEKLSGPFAREVAIEHWRYARWMLPARLLTATRNNLFIFVLPIWGGLEAAGALRALMNLVMPLGFMQNSLELILVPILVRARNNKSLHEKMALAAAFFVLNAIVYGAALVLFREEIITLLYKQQYIAYAGLVLLMALLPVVNGAAIVPGAALRAMERPKATFWAALGAAVATVLVGLPAIAIGGAAGALVGLLTSATVSFVILLFLLRSAFREEAKSHCMSHRG